eukprot:gene24183-19286_t
MFGTLPRRVLSDARHVAARALTASAASRDKIIITGGAGNLGTKLGTHMVSAGHDVHVIDAWDPSNSGSTVPGVTYHKYDMLTVEPGWVDVVADADAIVHLACYNPYPEASWDDVNKSMQITFNMMTQASAKGVSRFVFSSSNHVMGGYKELGGPYYNTDASLIKPTSPVEVGTKWDAGGMWMDSTGYASAKVAGEALAESLTQSGTSTTQFIT